MPETEPDVDPRGLIREAYQMAIGPAECRSIFLDWAIGLDTAGPAEVARLLAIWGPIHPEHPMTAVLREGAERAGHPRPRRSRAPGGR